MNEFLKKELFGWKLWESTWMAIATVSITIITIILGEDLLGLVAAVTGIICVILAGKGKLMTYFFAIIHIIAYAYICYNAKIMVF